MTAIDDLFFYLITLRSRHLSEARKINMRIYWTMRQIPELAMQSAVERYVSWRRVYPKTFRHWETWLGMLFCAGLTGLGSYIGQIFGAAYAAMIVGAALGGLVFSQATIHVARCHYKMELSANI